MLLPVYPLKKHISTSPETVLDVHNFVIFILFETQKAGQVHVYTCIILPSVINISHISQLNIP